MPRCVLLAPGRLGFHLAFLSFAMVLLTVLQAAAVHASTLDTVRDRGHLLCGITDNAPGFATVDASGSWRGFEIDTCKAVAAAVLGSGDAVQFRPLAQATRYTALANGTVDLIARGTSWSMSRDVALGLAYAGTLFHDGLALMVPTGFAVSSVLEMSGSTICAVGTTNALEILNAYFQPRQMKFQTIVEDRWSEAVKAYAAGRCKLLAGDVSELAAEKSKFADPTKHMLLPEVISKSPAGVVVRADDPEWRAVVAWTRNALIVAEELGVTSANIDSLRGNTETASIRRLLGTEGNLGQLLKLDPNWSYNVLKATGNYAEMFARNLGKDSPLGLRRGLNGLWNNGGIMYAFPLR